MIQFLSTAGVILTPLDERQLVFAGEALERFGKGRHPARLNFGDCFAYSLAKQMDAPLLFVGGDFAKTDVRIALGPL